VRLLSNYENGGITNLVTYSFRDAETGESKGKFYDERYSEAKAIYYGLYHQSESNNK
jgi:hypothetical protein